MLAGFTLLRAGLSQTLFKTFFVTLSKSRLVSLFCPFFQTACLPLRKAFLFGLLTERVSSACNNSSD